MIKILSYMSHDNIIDVPIPLEFSVLMLNLIQGENVLVGRNTFEQGMQEEPIPGSKTFVLSRSHKFRQVKSLSHPTDFRDGYVLGGPSTIASMMPYAGLIILGVDHKDTEFGKMFPSLSSFDLIEEIPDDGFDIRYYKKVRFS